VELNNLYAMSNETLIKQKFISRILREEGENIRQAQTQIMGQRGFTSRELFSDRRFTSDKNKLTYTHLPKHRFIDMSSRQTKQGKIKKVAHPIHNKILMGHANDIVFRMGVEYTSRMKEMLLQEFPQHI